MKKQLLCLILIMLPLVASAHDIEVQNGDEKTIYYNFTNNGTELEVTFQGNYYTTYSNEYTGNMVIPQEVTYMNNTYKVTSIGISAFYSCYGLTSVTIPNSVTTIGEHAFYGCSGLTSVTIPNSVTTISEDAFSDCSSLTSVTIPNSVTRISGGVFMRCTRLTSITIPNSVTTSGEHAFYNCYSLTSITIPNSVTSIGNNAFYSCWNLTSITIPNSVTSIGENAFSGCTGLKKVIVSDIATWCSIDFGNNEANPLNYARYLYSDENAEIKDLVIPTSVTSIGNYAFSCCFGLNSVTIGNSVTSIGEDAFCYCTSLTSITIGNSVTSIGNNAFNGCSGLKKVIVPDLGAWCSIRFGSNPLFYANHLYIDENTEIMDLIVPNGVTSIGDKAFYGCSSLTSVTIPNSVTSIGDYAFYCCFGLTSVTIGNSVKRIGDESFMYCTGLTSVTIGNSVTSIGNDAFMGCQINSVVIPRSVVSLGENAFDCISLKELIFEDGEDTLQFSPRYGTRYSEPKWFDNCPLDTVYIGRDIDYSFVTTDSHQTQDHFSPFRDNDSLRTVSFGKKVKVVPKYMFQNCTQLNHVELSNSITDVGWMAFYDCKNLKTLIIEDSENSLCLEDKNCFSNCPLTEIYLGRNITYQNVSPFFAVESIKKLTLGSKVTRLNDRIFAGCPNLTEVYSYSETVPTSGESVFTESYLQNAILNVPYSLYDEYRVTNPWSKFGNIHNFEGKYNLFYLVDGEEYKKYVIDFGESITPEAEPTKEGYIFSGWSEIPETMPEHDVTINGTFSALSYKLVYLVDGIEYRTYDVSYGTAITPEAAPEKEGYSFSGWSEIPETMPAHDVTVTGTFTINKYKLTYVVDNEVYKSYELDYGATITPEAAPEKEGYTFSGWSEIPETMPACDVTVTGSFSINKYKLTYVVDGEEYKSYEVEYGATITPEVYPTKEGYTFSGWSEIPGTMPANDVTITGSFTINQYQVTYIVDGAIFKTEYVNYASKITPPSVPEKEGYSFTWNEYPETMPANDIIITGQYTINSYKLSYVVDGVEYKSYDVVYNAAITPEPDPTKEGYSFSGWSEIPETMPAHDVTISGTFDINMYKLTYIMDNKVYKETKYEYGATIIPEPQPEGDYASFEWINQPQTMPAHDVVVYAVYTSGISDVLMANQRNIRIYSPNGKKLNKLQKGLNIVILDDGTVKRVVVK